LEIGAPQNIAHLILYKLLVLTKFVDSGVDLLNLVVQGTILAHSPNKVTLINRSIHSGMPYFRL
jgi:hypothetical protein